MKATIFPKARFAWSTAHFLTCIFCYFQHGSSPHPSHCFLIKILMELTDRTWIVNRWILCNASKLRTIQALYSLSKLTGLSGSSCSAIYSIFGVKGFLIWGIWNRYYIIPFWVSNIWLLTCIKQPDMNFWCWTQTSITNAFCKGWRRKWCWQ